MREMLYHIAPTISLVTEEVPFSHLHASYAESRHGRYLAQAVRYDRYKPRHISNAEWVRRLGADVNNLDHMLLTDQLTVGFLRSCRLARSEDEQVNNLAVFTSHEEQLLRLAAIYHDWAEGIKGHYDKSFDQKTEKDEQRELVALARIVRIHAANVTTDTKDENLLVREMGEVRRTILGDKTTKLGQAFNAIERLGYLRTGIRAWTEKGKTDDCSLQEGFTWLTGNVLGNQIVPLLHYAETYPPIREYLTMNRKIITNVFHCEPSELFKHCETTDERIKQQQRFDQARDAWNTSTFAYVK